MVADWWLMCINNWSSSNHVEYIFSFQHSATCKCKHCSRCAPYLYFPWWLMLYSILYYNIKYVGMNNIIISLHIQAIKLKRVVLGKRREKKLQEKLSILCPTSTRPFGVSSTATIWGVGPRSTFIVISSASKLGRILSGLGCIALSSSRRQPWGVVAGGSLSMPQARC